MELIAASRAAHARQRRRRRGLIGGGFAVLAGFGVVVALLAIAERHGANNARDQANKAAASDRESRVRLATIAHMFAEPGRQLVVDGHFQEAVPYLLEARRNGEDSVPLKMMFWAASRRLPLIPALEHQDGVVSAAFSPDGTRVVTASEDKTARVWDAATGKPVTSPLEHQDSVRSAAFSPDGARVVTASGDKTARVWDVRLDEGTLERWSAVAERSPFVLSGVALVRRGPRLASTPADSNDARGSAADRTHPSIGKPTRPPTAELP